MRKVPLLFLLFFPLFCSAAHWDVSTSQELHDALSKAAAGDEIVISPGTYEGTFSIPTSLSLRGSKDSIIDAAGYPRIEKYNRSTKAGLVLPKEWIYFLPAPTDPFDENGTELGATFYGQTVTSESPEFELAPGEQPGVVVGVYREDRIPYTVEVMADAVTLPVARDANRAMAVKVL